MAMGTRQGRQRAEDLWIPTSELAKPAGHPFYERLNRILDEHDFDRFVEDKCRGFYATERGRPGLVPGIYFRLLLVGYFDGIDSERGIAWRAEDSLSLRYFLAIGLNEATPDHSTISRGRQNLAGYHKRPRQRRRRVSPVQGYNACVQRPYGSRRSQEAE